MENNVSTFHHKLMNSLDPDIKFIFENDSAVANFLDVSCSTKNDQLMLDITAAVTRNTLKIILLCHWGKQSFV